MEDAEAHTFMSGQPVVVESLHGTTNDGLTIFDRRKANIESDLGAGFYSSSSPLDVERNYANADGPDLKAKIESLADRITQDDEFEGDYDDAKEEARRQLSDGAPNTMLLYVRFKNPAVLGDEGETFLDWEVSYNEETDEYGEPTGKLEEFIRAMQTQAGRDLDVYERGLERAVEELRQNGQDNGGISLTDAIKIVKQSVEAFSYDNGQHAGAEFVRQTLEAMGFDGVIDTTVSRKFRGMRLSEGTRHYIAFKPNQIKSAIGNRGTFDEDSDNILFQRAPSTDSPEFKRWFKNSKVVRKDGTPKVMYHGTARDIAVFRPKQAGAIFLTPDTGFADSFAITSERYMIEKGVDALTGDQKQAVVNEVFDRIKREYPNDLDVRNSLNQELLDWSLGNVSAPEGEVLDYVQEAAQKFLDSGQNIMPVYVSAQDPFDYEDRAQVEMLTIALARNARADDVEQYARSSREMIKAIMKGDWSIIEAPNVQKAIRDIGHDGFYVEEGDVKNLAVYKSSQIKSAIGNIGTYDPENDDIRFSRDFDPVGDTSTPEFKSWFRKSALVNKEGEPLTLYHGTRALNIQSFRPSEDGALGPGIYVTESFDAAASYAGDGGAIEILYGVIERPLIVYAGKGEPALKSSCSSCCRRCRSRGTRSSGRRTSSAVVRPSRGRETRSRTGRESKTRTSGPCFVTLDMTASS